MASFSGAGDGETHHLGLRAFANQFKASSVF